MDHEHFNIKEIHISTSNLHFSEKYLVDIDAYMIIHTRRYLIYTPTSILHPLKTPQYPSPSHLQHQSNNSQQPQAQRSSLCRSSCDDSRGSGVHSRSCISHARARRRSSRVSGRGASAVCGDGAVAGFARGVHGKGQGAGNRRAVAADGDNNGRGGARSALGAAGWVAGCAGDLEGL